MAGFGIGRPQPHGSAITIHGLTGLALEKQDVAEIVPGLGRLGPEPDGLAKVLGGLIGP